MRHDAGMSDKPKPPVGSLWEITFHVLNRDRQQAYTTWSDKPRPEDAKADAIEKMRADKQDPEHYDIENPIIIGIPGRRLTDSPPDGRV